MRIDVILDDTRFPNDMPSNKQHLDVAKWLGRDMQHATYG